MIFDWDDQKSERTLRRRGFDFTFASRLFDDDVESFADDRADYGEARVIAFGLIDGLRYAVVYTMRGDVRWIISAFRVRERELRRWRERVTGAR